LSDSSGKIKNSNTMTVGCQIKIQDSILAALAVTVAFGENFDHRNERDFMLPTEPVRDDAGGATVFRLFVILPLRQIFQPETNEVNDIK